MPRKVKTKPPQVKITAKAPKIIIPKSGKKLYEFSLDNFKSWKQANPTSNFEIKDRLTYKINPTDEPYVVIEISQNDITPIDFEANEVASVEKNPKVLESMLEDKAANNAYTMYQYVDSKGMTRTAIEVRGNLPENAVDLLNN